MENIFHYTSNENWEKIQRTGLLFPKTGVDRNSTMDWYVVGLQHPQCEGWIECGLMDYLIEYTTGKVCLDMPILNTNGAFVRDHAYLSPKRFIEEYGQNLIELIFKKAEIPMDTRFINAKNQYYESEIPLNQYKGDYSVPEIWLPQTTPISKIKKLDFMQLSSQ